jgi:XTP/dITP diphosphohydrolase
VSPVLVVATKNPGKVKEIRHRLSALDLAIEGVSIELPPEDGDTFEANARIKAEHVAAKLGVAALADDSGLVVDALGGAPGVSSARYAVGSDADRVAKLLAAIASVPDPERTARFVCAMVLAIPGHPSITAEGACDGWIGRTPRGTGGFGYDPVFVLPDGRTMAELTLAEKDVISHRGRALDRILPRLVAALFP